MLGVGGAHHAASWSWVDFIFTALGLWGSIAALVVGVALITLTLQRGLPRRKRRSSGDERREPPLFAETLLCIFARPKDREALLGDFEEYFERDCARGMSGRRASTLYWARVVHSIGPQMWQAFKRLGLFGLIAAALRR
jgi:hypothetical protein